jgi:hypothetical protein
VTAPKIKVNEVRFFERPVVLRMPFRFGIVTLTEAPQIFVRARITHESGLEAWGAAAEMLVPKWFDKNPDLSNEDNFDQLRFALAVARDLYLQADPMTAYGLMAETYQPQRETCAEQDLNPLVAGYGPALLDRAVLDALCRMDNVSFYNAIRSNLPGIAPDSIAPDLAGFHLDGYLSALTPQDSLHARHTVGLVDQLTASETRVDDGLPETLEEVIAAYGHRWFKIKIGGEIDADLERLQAIASVLDRALDDYSVSLDGNEQFDDVDGIMELWRRATENPSLRRFMDAVSFIEQPIARSAALDRDIAPLAALRPVIIDESDNGFDIFPKARELGYAGVSSKQCKGIYKSIINGARCANWNASGNASGSHHFISGEDLTCQAGLGVQQDLALVSLLGITHVERNGHHYARGMAAAPAAEQAEFAMAHADIYELRDGIACLRISDGIISIQSLDAAGYAHNADPDWSAMTEMEF